jgi:putative cardiolipin synthase
MSIFIFCVQKYFRNCLAALLLSLLPVTGLAQSLQDWVDASCKPCSTRMGASTGVYILEKGEEALMGRAWLAQHATQSIDIQYFIWSTDNIGILAAQMLLEAADRGVTVRVLVDDFLIDAEDKTLALLAAHPLVNIRIYNPNFSVGTSFFRRMLNSAQDFRATNQRMHDKTAIFDGLAGITGGRNMADEYFDFDNEYNFRDRDVLLLGAVVRDMNDNFEEFWQSALAVPVEQLFENPDQQVSAEEVQARYRELQAYARNPENFELPVREAIRNMPTHFPALLRGMAWQDVRFISDVPGKNSGNSGLSGGGASTSALISAVRAAQASILIQSPYLILPEGGLELFTELHARGVRIRVSTNSLASTDNLPAFSGYFKQRADLLKAGIELYEFKPHPQIQSELVDRRPGSTGQNSIFALHAKSMVIDGKQIFIGTFNLDPRSANLNTEVGVLIESESLGQQLTASIERDIRPENSWRTTSDFNPDGEVSYYQRLKLEVINLFPIDPIL